jgi:TPR repeat protein
MRIALTILIFVVFVPLASAQERDPRIDEYVQLCEDGDAFYCNYAAGLLVREDPQSWLTDRNVALHMRGCELGSDRSCWKFEAMAFPDPYGPVRDDTARYLPIARSGCRNGSSMACAQTAAMLMEMGPEVHDEATDAARRSCEDGFGDGCARLADLVERGGGDANPAAIRTCYGVRPGYIRKQPYCQRACDDGDAIACRTLAQILEWGRDGAQPLRADPRRATVLYERACSLGDAAACVRPGR